MARGSLSRNWFSITTLAASLERCPDPVLCATQRLTGFFYELSYRWQPLPACAQAENDRYLRGSWLAQELVQELGALRILIVGDSLNRPFAESIISFQNYLPTGSPVAPARYMKSVGKETDLKLGYWNYQRSILNITYIQNVHLLLQSCLPP